MNTYDFPVEGVVISCSDPQQEGRVKVYIPAIDGEQIIEENLPWARVASQVAGSIIDYPAGSSNSISSGNMAYGMWAPPRIGAQVIVMFLFGDALKRVVIGSFWPTHLNRSLPTGRMRSDISSVPLTDSLDSVEPHSSNLRTQFGGDVTSSIAQTRGVFERNVAMDATEKDGTRGYQKSPKTGALEPQTTCWVSPGRHAIIFQDHPSTARMRMVTAEGTQVILDDANERIYISTAQGNTWVELDWDGHMNVHAAASLSVGVGKDINLTAGGNINLTAGGTLNLSAGKDAYFSACGAAHISGGTLNLDSGAVMNVLAEGTLILTGSTISLNGTPAEAADCAASAAIVPAHEPWVRPSSFKRGQNWKA